MPKSPRFSPNPVRVIDVLTCPAVQLLDVTGPVQVFASANDLIVGAGGARPYELKVAAQGGNVVTASAGVTLAAAPLSQPDEPPDSREREACVLSLLTAGRPERLVTSRTSVDGINSSFRG